MHLEYKLYVRLDDISSLSELSARAAEYEAIEKQRRELRNEKKTATEPAVAAATYCREECCWKCKQRGHTRFDCKRPPKKFCSRCGKDGVLTKDCHPFMENTTGAGRRRCTPVPDKIPVNCLPRPHMTIEFRQQPYSALLDSGSERFFINHEVIHRAKTLGYCIQEETRTVHLANNSSAEILGAVTLPVTIGARELVHEFLTMPSVKTLILIG